MTELENRLGKPKEESITFQIEDISISNIHEAIEKLIKQSKTTRTSVSLNIYILFGGIAGAKYTETKKLK